MPDAPRQLLLPFGHEPRFAASDFLAGAANAAALAWLEPRAAWPRRRLALWGAEGTGKTHLLHIWAGRERATLFAGPLLPREPRPVVTAIAIDDADTAPERALLHLLNAADEAGQPVLLAARAPPARWPTSVPDLASRLRATTAVELRLPEDSLLRALLARLLADRQLAVPMPVQDWLLARLPRTPAALREAAARLDHEAMIEGRGIGRALAARVLQSMSPTAVGDEELASVAQPASSGAPCLL